MDFPTAPNPYRIQKRWLLKNLVGRLCMGIISVLFLLLMIGFAKILNLPISDFIDGIGLVLFITAPFIGLIFLFYVFSIAIAAWKVANFHYSLGDIFITLHQGIVSKQQRNVPYSVIQAVFLRQSLFDRLVGIASITIEDYSQGGRSSLDMDGMVRSGKNGRVEILGFYGNRIHIPGLKKQDAESLKNIILQKIKENPIEDSGSGL